MRKVGFLIIFILFLLPINTNVFAIMFVEMKPKEVLKRSEVVVMGTYDFSSESTSRNHIYQGYLFNVDTVYKGESPGQIVAGMVVYDIGSAKAFQDEGGKYLLFLEKYLDTDFLVPVAGINGMIEIVDGKVHHYNKSKAKFYDKFLKSQQSTSPKIEKGPLVITLAVLIGIVFFLITRLSARHRNKGEDE